VKIPGDICREKIAAAEFHFLYPVFPKAAGNAKVMEFASKEQYPFAVDEKTFFIIPDRVFGHPAFSFL
jgi:hypothetical protein